MTAGTAKAEMHPEAVIGLEVHAQLRTRRKLFCGCPTEFGASPNSQTCPVCLGHPGCLPVVNRQAVELALRAGLTVGATIRERSLFARKNYFYPDLPKAYQISQYEEPLMEGGSIPITVEGATKEIRLVRIHLEEDAGKSKHPERKGETETLVDLNRCGVPLIEIVSEPDLRSPGEARAYIIALRQLLQYLDVCDGNMEEGSLRCDANISLRPEGSEQLGTPTEIKNLNSIRNVEKALEAEMGRQIQILNSGGVVLHSTLLFDQLTGDVRPMRSKEEAHDYRYFPEPDLPPLVVEGVWIEEVSKKLPELPWDRRRRFHEELGLSLYDAEVLTQERVLADYFETCLGHLGSVGTVGTKLAAHWIQNELLRILKEEDLTANRSPVSPQDMARLVRRVFEGSISGKMGKDLFEEMLKTQRPPDEIVAEKGWIQIRDEGTIRGWVVEALDTNPDQLAKLLGGKETLARFFVGQVMKVSKGRADPEMVNRILAEELEARRK
jgi:aspartyl-tRNA(Asn)/glutamyl-tRNA(Gln) amidotransferase subunit B